MALQKCFLKMLLTKFKTVAVSYIVSPKEETIKDADPFDRLTPLIVHALDEMVSVLGASPSEVRLPVELEQQLTSYRHSVPFRAVGRCDRR